MQRAVIKNQENLDLVVNYYITQGKSRGLVFVEHGFTGTKDAIYNKKIIKTFVDNNYSVVAFDATDSAGESASSAEGFTFTRHYNDLKDVISWSKSQEWFEAPFVLLGHSMGGLSVIYYTQNYPEDVRLLIPVCPVITGDLTYKAFANQEFFKSWQKTGVYTKISEYTGRAVVVKFSCLDDIKKYSAYDLIDKIKIKTVFLAGDSDVLTPLEDTRKFYEALNCQKELKIIKNCPHTMKTEENLKDLETYILDIIKKDELNAE